MASSKFKIMIRTIAERNGYNTWSYTDEKIEKREREALRNGKTSAEFYEAIFQEVNTPFEAEREERESAAVAGYSECPECGKKTLIHEGGCAVCRECGYSRCG